MLSLDKVDEYLISTFTRDNPAPPTGGVVFEDNSFFLKSSNAMTEITQILTEHARNPVASIAAFGWSLILRSISEVLYSLGLDIDDIDPPAPEPSTHTTPAKRRRTGLAAADLYLSTLSGIFAHSPQGKSTMAYLAKTAISECRVFEVIVQLVTSVAMESTGGIAWSMVHEEDGEKMKAVLASFVRKATEIVEFSQGVVSAVLVLNEVPITEAWEITHSPESTLLLDNEDPIRGSPTSNMSEVVDKFWSDSEALTKILLPARARFPYEPLPFLKIIKSLATDPTRTHMVLTKMETFTQVLPAGFSDYENCCGNNGLNSLNGNGSTTGSVDETESSPIKLLDELCLFAPRAASGYESSDQFIGGGGIIIPRQTKGKVISDNRTAPPIVMWEHGYSALVFFGRILECALVGSAGGGSSTVVGRRGGGSAIADQLGNKEAVGEIISILTTMILSCSLSSNGSATERSEHVTTLLEEASEVVARNRDVVSIIFDLLEDELQGSSRGIAASQGTEFITIGLQFVDALAPVLPNRVWPYLARSSLLERHGKEGTLMRITNGIEVVRGDYSFTCSALRLFEDLVEDGIKGVVEKTGIVGAPDAIPSAKKSVVGAGVSALVQKEILEEWTHWGVDLFESYRGWKYSAGGERMEIGKLTLN